MGFPSQVFTRWLAHAPGYRCDLTMHPASSATPHATWVGSSSSPVLLCTGRRLYRARPHTVIRRRSVTNHTNTGASVQLVTFGMQPNQPFY
ncbi:hypothetical protein NDU88_001444 [Pleurodeles waltl]|uniref:Uncharacterized protein n=1 Tax=Pleurodeles waltl TaxID=8319 RepID=A0AAV7LXM9_PLEWA|nr:hypothetical protein NDU88_001444 [Pleurodeles waltl]